MAHPTIPPGSAPGSPARSSWALRTLLSVAIAAVLLAALAHFGGMSFGQFAEALRRLPAWTYALGLAVHAAIYALRAARFRYLLPPRSRPSFGKVLIVSSAHNLASYVLPAKTGEATYVVYMKSVCGVPGFEGLASLLVSRLLDVATLAGCIAAASLAIAAGAEAEQRSWLLPVGGALLAFASLAGVFCARSQWIVAIFLFVARLARLARTALGRRILARAQELAAALRHASAEGRLLGAALLSLPLWLGVFAFYAVLARGLGLAEWSDLPQAAFGSGLATAANLLPVNGLAGFGTQEAGWVVGFGLLGVPADLALSTGLGVHLVQLFNVVLFGLAGHLLMGLAASPGESRGIGRRGL